MMKNFDKTVLDYIQKESLILSNKRLLVACSGGVDSIALLHFLAVNQKVLDVEIGAVHIDHMLRGSESEADGELVRILCEKLNVPCYRGNVPVPEIYARDGGNIQAICREGRYDYFAKIMKEHQYGILVTGHHAEDQLETILMQVTKSVSLLGIPNNREFANGRVIRPFLPVVKESLYQYALENDLSYNEDPSNDSDDYMRNRFRRHLIPQILQENPKAAEGIVGLAGSLQEDEAFLQTLAKNRLEEFLEFTEDELPSINIRTFKSMPTALQKRMIPLLLEYVYDKKNGTVHYKSTLIDQLLHHLNSEDGNVTIHMPLGYKFVRQYGHLMFVKDASISIANLGVLKVVPKGERIHWLNGLWIYWSDVDEIADDLLLTAKEIMYFDFPEESLPLYVRNRKVGDRIRLPGMNNAKRLSRLFIDEKVAMTKRDCLPIIIDNNDQVVAVPEIRYGLGFTKDYLATSKYIFIIGE